MRARARVGKLIALRVVHLCKNKKPRAALTLDICRSLSLIDREFRDFVEFRNVGD